MRERNIVHKLLYVLFKKVDGVFLSNIHALVVKDFLMSRHMWDKWLEICQIYTKGEC